MNFENFSDFELAVLILRLIVRKASEAQTGDDWAQLQLAVAELDKRINRS